MFERKTVYQCIAADFPTDFVAGPPGPTYDIFVSLLSYGKRGLGTPPLDLKPRISGLLKDDAFCWALGQAQVILGDASWRITKLDLDGDKREYFILLEDKLGAQRAICISSTRWDTESSLRKKTKSFLHDPAPVPMSKSGKRRSKKAT